MKAILLVIIGVNLGSFLAAADAQWEAHWKGLESYTAPPELEVGAEVPPEAFTSAQAPAVALIPNPENAALPPVLGLRDYSDSASKEGAFIAKDGFSASRAELRFRFQTRTPRRNGNLLVRLMNAEGQALASFQLYALGREEGEIQLNTFGPEGDRRMPTETPVYEAGAWNDVRLEYDGAGLVWSLRIDGREFRNLPVDANLSDTRVARFEIHSGFGAASKTFLLLDSLSFQTSTP